jgi:hypothetical protein
MPPDEALVSVAVPSSNAKDPVSISLNSIPAENIWDVFSTHNFRKFSTKIQDINVSFYENDGF